MGVTGLTIPSQCICETNCGVRHGVVEWTIKAALSGDEYAEIQVRDVVKVENGGTPGRGRGGTLPEILGDHHEFFPGLPGGSYTVSSVNVYRPMALSPTVGSLRVASPAQVQVGPTEVVIQARRSDREIELDSPTPAAPDPAPDSPAPDSPEDLGSLDDVAGY